MLADFSVKPPLQLFQKEDPAKGLPHKDQENIDEVNIDTKGSSGS